MKHKPIKLFTTLAASALLLQGCASVQTPCLGEELQAQPVFEQGFEGPPAYQANQWKKVISYLQCAYPTPSTAAIERIEKIKGYEAVAVPDDMRWLFDSRQEWRNRMLGWAEKRNDDSVERHIARDYELTKELKQAIDVYTNIYHTKNKLAGHDIAFGLLHGWDGNKPDDFAAKFWYAKTYIETGHLESLEACKVIEEKRSGRKKNQDLNTCRIDLKKIEITQETDKFNILDSNAYRESRESQRETSAKSSSEDGDKNKK